MKKMLIAIMAGILACGSGFAQTNWGKTVMYDSKTYKFLEPKIVLSNDLATVGGSVSNAQYAGVAGIASNLVGSATVNAAGLTNKTAVPLSDFGAPNASVNMGNQQLTNSAGVASAGGNYQIAYWGDGIFRILGYHSSLYDLVQPVFYNDWLGLHINTNLTFSAGHWVDFSGCTLTNTGSVIPAGSNTVDLGTAALPFRDLYLDTNSVWMGGTKVLSYNPATTSLVANVPIASTSGAVSVTVTGTPTNGQVIAWNAAGSVWNPTNQSGGGSSSPGKWTVVVSTTNINVLVGDVAKTFVMQPTVSLTNYLPSVAFSDIGTWYTFVKNGTNRLTIKAADADVIADSGAGATIYDSVTNEYYATVTLQLANGTNWVITGAHGTWTSTTD
jgi:hypothetical protein